MRNVIAGAVSVGVGCGFSCGIAGAQEVPEPPARTAEALAADAEREIGALTEMARLEPRRILLLGVFHFKDAGLDAYKPQHSFDALSERRQSEIRDVLDRLDGFDADVVCVEAKPDFQMDLDERFDGYLEGAYELPANEIYQLGFRLAEREELDGVVAIDAEPRWYEPREDLAAWARENGQTEKLRSPFDRLLLGHMQERDRRVDAWHLIDTLLSINTEARLEASHGLYFTRGFGVGDGTAFPGVDGFVSSWYNRNLRIFQNIINATAPGDDVVVIIGRGHVPLLRHMAECSPEFEVVEVVEVLGDGE